MFGKLNIRGDKIIWIVVFLLSGISILAVYSSTSSLAYKYQGGNTEYYLIKHTLILLAGLGLMYLAHCVKYTTYSRIFQILLYIAIILLVITLIFGLNLNQAKRSIMVFGLSFQTSDLAKLTLIVYLARMLTKKQNQISDLRSAFIPLIVPVIIVCFLILPADFSTAAILFTTSLVLMFVGRVKLKHIFSTIGIGLVMLTILILLSKGFPDLLPRLNTWTARIENFKSENTEENYQVEQAKIAIASGGIIGKGPGNSDQRNFLPHPYSDFIYAFLIEEYGLAMGILIIILYMVLLFRAIIIVGKSPKNFGAFLAIGVAFSIVFQAMINMGVAVNLLPVTGQPLPLVSMGGTSFWFSSIGLGILLSVSKEIEKNETESIENESIMEINGL